MFATVSSQRSCSLRADIGKSDALALTFNRLFDTNLRAEQTRYRLRPRNFLKEAMKLE